MGHLMERQLDAAAGYLLKRALEAKGIEVSGEAESMRRLKLANKLPEATTYAIVGAGVHGMSTALHLAMELEARGTGSAAACPSTLSNPLAGSTANSARLSWPRFGA